MNLKIAALSKAVKHSQKNLFIVFDGSTCMKRFFNQISCIQSQKTRGFRVADFATLSDERRSRSEIFLLFNVDKKTFRSKI